MSNPSPQLNGKNAQVSYEKTVTFTSGTTSSEVDLAGFTLVGIVTPASLASTSITFKVASSSGGTAVTLKDKDNSAYTATVDSSAAQYYFDPAVFAGVRFVTLEAGSSETSKTVTLVVRPII